MTLVSFQTLMAEANRGNYAVGYFESWNLESLQAVADAAEATGSPVILGFSGIHLPDPDRTVKDRLSGYAALGLDTCRQLSVPACLLFNESPYLGAVMEAIDLGFGLVMFSDEKLDAGEQVRMIRLVVEKAHAAGAAVEAELGALPGVGGGLQELPEGMVLTGAAEARAFAERTGVDALAVNVGQAHLHGRAEVYLDLARLAGLAHTVPVPLVLHGATSVARRDLAQAVSLGIRKINVGSALKQAYFEALRQACASVPAKYNPYDVVGSGHASDVLIAGRVAVQRVTEELMHLFGSAGKATARQIVERSNYGT